MIDDAKIDVNAEPKPASDLARAAAIGGIKGALCMARYDLLVMFDQNFQTETCLHLRRRALAAVERAIRIADDADAYLADTLEFQRSMADAARRQRDGEQQ